MADNNESKIDTIIGAASQVKGDVIVDGSVLVAGTVKGDVISKDLVRVVESAIIEGNLEAKDAIIAGRVNGSVLCQGKVQLGKKAALMGDLRAARLIIEEGAVFTGSCEMPAKDDEKAPQAEGAKKQNAAAKTTKAKEDK